MLLELRFSRVKICLFFKLSLDVHEVKSGLRGEQMTLALLSFRYDHAGGS